jgi:hypothetical protein
LEIVGKYRLYGIPYGALLSFHAKQHKSQVDEDQCSYESGHKNAIISAMQKPSSEDDKISWRYPKYSGIY